MRRSTRCRPRAGATLQFRPVPAPSLLHLKQPICRWGLPYNLQAACYVLTVFLHEATA